MFWEATSTDAWGHIQDESFGNGVKAFTDFDQANGWMEARQGGIGGGNGLLDALVNWDKNGNLTERVDLKQSGTCRRSQTPMSSAADRGTHVLRVWPRGEDLSRMIDGGSAHAAAVREPSSRLDER